MSPESRERLREAAGYEHRSMQQLASMGIEEIVDRIITEKRPAASAQRQAAFEKMLAQANAENADLYERLAKR